MDTLAYAMNRVPGAVADFPRHIAGAMPDAFGHIARRMADDSSGLFDFGASAH